MALGNPTAPIQYASFETMLCVWVLCPLLEEPSQLVRIGAVGWWSHWRNRVDAIMLSALVGALVLRVYLGVTYAHDTYAHDTFAHGHLSIDCPGTLGRVSCRILMASSAMFQVRCLMPECNARCDPF